MHAELAEYVVQVLLDRPFGNAEGIRNLAVADPLHQQIDDLPLAAGGDAVTCSLQAWTPGADRLAVALPCGGRLRADLPLRGALRTATAVWTQACRSESISFGVATLECLLSPFKPDTSESRERFPHSSASSGCARLVKCALPSPVPIVITAQCFTSCIQGNSLSPCTTASLCIRTTVS